MTSTPANLAHQQVEQLARAIAGRPGAAEFYRGLAEMHWRARDLDGYATFYRRSYLLKPSTSILRSAATAQELRDRAYALVDRGIAYSPVIAALAAAEARLGNGPAVRKLMDSDRFVLHGAIDPPEGMSIAAFNHALASEIKSNLKFYASGPARPIQHAWRFNALHRAATPALRTLRELLQRQADRYGSCLPPDPAHPFIASRPAEFEVGGWAVVSDGASYHESHVHPYAWATGVYYVVQPEVSRAPGSDRGWLRLGPPPDLDEAFSRDWKRELIEPVPGSFVLMPGYFWHETAPMGVDQERICVAFELRPPELRLGDDKADD
jgi:hypothetical protein